MYCSHCGKELEEGAKFCSYCGEKVGSYSGTFPTKQKSDLYSDKSRLAAGLLQIFLGGFGIGRFYLGYIGLGVAQLLVSIFTLGIGSVWGFIDGILILTGFVKEDGKGKTLEDL